MTVIIAAESLATYCASENLPIAGGRDIEMVLLADTIGLCSFAPNYDFLPGSASRNREIGVLHVLTHAAPIAQVEFQKYRLRLLLPYRRATAFP